MFEKKNIIFIILIDASIGISNILFFIEHKILKLYTKI